MGVNTNVKFAASSLGHWGEMSAVTARIERQRREHGVPHITVGRSPGENAVMLANNDYLGLSKDPRIVAAQVDALQSGSSDLMMSGVYAHFLGSQKHFEHQMATFLGADAVVLCQSGFAANDGLLQCLADEATPVYIDFFAHASLWQGAHSAGAPVHPFRHNSAENLRSLVQRHGPGLVAVDSIYSSLGDLCPLEEILTVCEEFGCIPIVDESHAVGVYGVHGEGVVGAHGLCERVPYRTFSLSKAFVGRGGVIAGPARVIEYFKYESRPAIFSSAVLDWEIARFTETLQVIRGEHVRRARLHRNADMLKGRLSELGYDVANSQSAIIPLEAGPEQNTFRLREALERRGIFGAVFCAPATPKNRSMVRLCANATLSEEQLDRVVGVCAEIRQEVRLSEWPSSKRRRRGQRARLRVLEGRTAAIPPADAA